MKQTFSMACFLLANQKPPAGSSKKKAPGWSILFGLFKEVVLV
jgi:hypothetical protein